MYYQQGGCMFIQIPVLKFIVMVSQVCIDESKQYTSTFGAFYMLNVKFMAGQFYGQVVDFIILCFSF